MPTPEFPPTHRGRRFRPSAEPFVGENRFGMGLRLKALTLE